MTTKPPEEQPENPTVAQYLGAYSADDFKEWFLRGFRAMAAGDASKQPFGMVRFAYPHAEDISDVLAEAYFDLTRAQPAHDGDEPFTLGLEAAFRSLSARNQHDQRSLIDILRLAAKIRFARLLPLIVKKLFRAGEQPEDSEKRLRSVALDVAIELSSQSPNAAASLQDIIQSNLFRPTAARTILLALCSARPQDLLHHLFRLEEALVGTFGESTTVADEALWKRRTNLLADILRFCPASIVLAVIQYCLQNTYWRLAWLADVLFDPRKFDQLPEAEAETLRTLYEGLPGRQIEAVRLPIGVKPITVCAPTIHENRRNTDILTSDDVEPEQDEMVRLSVIARLARGEVRFGLIGPDLRTQMLYDSEFKGAA